MQELTGSLSEKLQIEQEEEVHMGDALIKKKSQNSFAAAALFNRWQASRGGEERRGKVTSKCSW